MNFEVIPYALPFKEPYVTARGTLTRREMVLLRIRDEDGVEGLGEAVPLSLRGGVTVADVVRELEELEDIRKVPEGLSLPALCAVTTALIDLKEKREGDDAWHAPVKCNATLVSGAPGAVAAEAERWAAQARFWSAVASACADSPAIFCYDLINEPLATGSPRKFGDWYSGKPLGPYDFLQFINLDAAGRTLTPGFVDLHMHGGGGADVSDGPGGLADVLRTHRAHGSTRTVLSLVSASVADLVVTLTALAPVVRRDPLLLGVHLEGPFLSPDNRGAHDPAALTLPTPDAIGALLDAAGGTLAQVTIAPELPGAAEAIAQLVAAGVRVAVGHTTADLATAGAAFDAGASLLTHAFNAMPGLAHREPGPIGAALERPGVVLELIADGLHVHPIVVAALFRLAPGRVALITDAMSAAGFGDGDYRLGPLDVVVRDGAARLADGHLAGHSRDRAALLSRPRAAGNRVPPRRSRHRWRVIPSGQPACAGERGGPCRRRSPGRGPASGVGRRTRQVLD